jgi:mannose-6-phosphate isomerase-like protein (cupin superfamily)
MAYHINIEKKSIKNSYYRNVLYTTTNTQLVVMSLKPNTEIGLEKHRKIDQFIRIESGTGKAIITNNKKEIIQTITLTDGSAIVIPKNTYHNIINTGSDKLKLYSIYSPPNHPPQTLQKNKPDDD